MTVNEQFPVVVEWDCNTDGHTFGDMLFPLAEVMMKFAEYTNLEISLSIRASSFFGKKVGSDILKIINKDSNEIINALLSIRFVKNIYLGNSKEELDNYITKDLGLKFSIHDPFSYRINGYVKGSSLLCQKFYNEGFKKPTLSQKEENNYLLVKFLQQYKSKTLIGVHLKNASSEKNISNANLDQWHGFLKKYDKNFIFLILGHDAIDKKFECLNNVIIVKKHFSKLSEHISLLQECDFFIGMSSLFCNFAIFSNKKYVIFKNPEHHCIEMERELGLGESFNFADDKQIFIRKNETVDLLSKYFNFITRISTQK